MSRAEERVGIFATMVPQECSLDCPFALADTDKREKAAAESIPDNQSA
jgi:hypothetical protein